MTSVSTCSHLTKKRDWSQHSRHHREEKKRDNIATEYHRIDEYFPILNKMELLILENEELKANLVAMMKKHFLQNTTKEPEVKGFLKILLDCARQNAGKKTGGYRYPDVVKEFATLVFTIGGLQNYEIISSNLPLPSAKGARRHLAATELIKEGDFRFGPVSNFLTKRKLPRKVWVGEDGTKNEKRIQYCSKTNQVVGLVPPLGANGLPVVGSFPATSAQLISSYLKNNQASSIAYCYMVQPLDPNAPTICLSLFGTDNRYTAEHVVKRWEWIAKNAKDQGDFEVVGFSSDGDGKQLRAMLHMSVLPKPPNPKWPWFQCSLEAYLIFIQDVIHILTKLKSRLLCASIIIPMGYYFFASRGHIVDLIKNHSKDLHDLTMSLIDGKDKMNYRAVQKLCDEKVINLLRKTPGCEATATYLQMIHDIMEAFLNPTLSPLERISLIWEWVFFLRLWRTWISKTNGYTLGHNFITSNSYSCIELNAHALIQVIRKFRDDEEPHLFLTWLMGSQCCEEFFGNARSMTSTQSTIVNFSMLEFQRRILRIDFIADSSHNLKDTIKLPRAEKKAKKSKEEAVFYPVLPEDYEIEQTVMLSFQRAAKRAIDFGMATTGVKVPKSFLTHIPASELSKKKPKGPTSPVVYDEDLSDAEEEVDNPSATSANQEQTEEVGEGEREERNVTEDLLMVSTGSLGLRSYSNVPLSENSPFVLVCDAQGKRAAIRKSTLLYLLLTGELGEDLRLSNDRLLRVYSDRINQRPNGGKHQNVSGPCKEESISVGDWCAFTEGKTIAVGRISEFSYLKGPTWKQQEYSALSVPTEPPAKNARGVGALCDWFTINKGNKLKATSMDVHGFYNITNYLCTLPRPSVSQDGKHFILPCSEKDISNYLKGLKTNRK